ncbi:MAG: superoxide dismutase, partial [Acidimicrobiales bacterium]|nr:superoxide dismutase [Acidimicrobiales bacterium]
MAFDLPELPYAKDALTGVSAETLDYHHGKHHNTYVKTLNDMIEGTEHADASLEDIIKAAPINEKLFNQAAQHWNHSFFWNCMAPGGGGAPSGELGDAINSAFGSYDAFVTEFSDAAKAQFGSGWAWLVDDGGLKVM